MPFFVWLHDACCCWSWWKANEFKVERSLANLANLEFHQNQTFPISFPFPANQHQAFVGNSRFFDPSSTFAGSSYFCWKRTKFFSSSSSPLVLSLAPLSWAPLFFGFGFRKPSSWIFSGPGGQGYYPFLAAACSSASFTAVTTRCVPVAHIPGAYELRLFLMILETWFDLHSPWIEIRFDTFSEIILSRYGQCTHQHITVPVLIMPVMIWRIILTFGSVRVVMVGAWQFAHKLTSNLFKSLQIFRFVQNN